MTATVYITRYALSHGIYKCQLRERFDDTNSVSVIWPGGLNGQAYFSKKDWRASLEDAEARAYEMRQKAIKTALKRIKLLEQMDTWRVIEP